MADLSFLDTREKAHEGIDVPLVIHGETWLGEDGEPVTFRIRGVHDAEVAKIIMATNRAGGSRTPEERDASDMKLARVAVVGWSDNVVLDGEPVPFSRANVERVFLIPLIRSAILGQIGDVRLFMKGA